MPIRTRVILSMILGNEEALIERCLDAARPVIDCIVVSVNGTDDTAAKVRDWAGRHELPCALSRQEWQNFGYNRTLAAETARAWAIERGWTLDATYLLFLDADHVLRVEPGFNKAELTAPQYHIWQVDGSLRYKNTRLGRLSQRWRSIGVTHEYWSPEPDVRPETLESLWIEDKNDGGSKANKTNRDIALLTEGLKQDPNNGRYMFYLAQALDAAGRLHEAIEWHERRIATGGWDEEVWYSRYKRGVLLMRLGEKEKATGALIAAWQARPQRAEPLAHLARAYREAGENHVALLFARQVLSMPVPNDILFVEPQAYTRLALEEIGICAYYAGTKAEGIAACDRLQTTRDLGDGAFYEYIARNASFYLEPLKSVGSGTFPIPAGLDEKYGMPYHGTNPSVVSVHPHSAVYAVHVRLVNYTQTGGRRYDAAGGVFRTRGAVLAWNAATGQVVLEPKEVTAVLPADWPETSIMGLEDCRWVQHAGRVWFTATCCQVPGAAGWPRVVLGLMSEDMTEVERVLPLGYGGTEPGAREKNWVPWSLYGELLLIYSYDPFVVLRVDTDTGACTEVKRWQPPFRAASWKGSASPVPGGLMLVHETAYMRDGSGNWTHSIYSHRWVELDTERLEIKRYSKPFVFDHRGVEYACGLVKSGPFLYVTYGLEDREARWARFTVPQVLALLEQP